MSEEIQTPLHEGTEQSPGAEDITAVRFIVGDTDASAPLLTDAQITAALEAAEGDHDRAALACLESLTSRFSLQADIATGDTKLSYSKAAENLAKREGDLRARIVAGGAPFAGGISRSDKETRRQDDDRNDGAFRRGQFNDRRNW